MANEQIVSMVALSEEINNLNFRIAQIIKDLNSDPSAVGNLKSLTDKLSGKIGDLGSKVTSYKPIDNKEELIEATPSYVSENKKQDKITPEPNVVPETPGSVGNNIITDEEDVKPIKNDTNKKKMAPRRNTKKGSPMKRFTGVK